MKKNKRSSQQSSHRNTSELGLRHLGQSTVYVDHYSPELLEAFDNRHPKKIAWTSLLCPEFTSLCPKTGQPDFGEITIHYIADKKMVESKSLKLYLFSFRNHGDFHEDCVQKICDDLVRLLKPHYLEVVGDFRPRGGIKICPLASYVRPGSKFSQLARTRLEFYRMSGVNSSPV